MAQYLPYLKFSSKTQLLIYHHTYTAVAQLPQRKMLQFAGWCDYNYCESASQCEYAIFVYVHDDNARICAR